MKSIIGAEHFSRIAAGKGHIRQLEGALQHDHSRWPTEAGGQECRNESTNTLLFGGEKGLEGRQGRWH